MALDPNYARYLRMAVEEQAKADEAFTAGAHPDEVEKHLTRAEEYREKAKEFMIWG